MRCFAACKWNEDCFSLRRPRACAFSFQPVEWIIAGRKKLLASHSRCEDRCELSHRLPQLSVAAISSDPIFASPKVSAFYIFDDSFSHELRYFLSLHASENYGTCFTTRLAPPIGLVRSIVRPSLALLRMTDEERYQIFLELLCTFRRQETGHRNDNVRLPRENNVQRMTNEDNGRAQVGRFLLPRLPPYGVSCCWAPSSFDAVALTKLSVTTNFLRA